MARPIKKGFDYFPLNVDIFNDKKLRFVAAKFHEIGEVTAVKLLCTIYKEGYFIKWDDDELILFLTDECSKNVTVEILQSIVDELLKRDFFNLALFQKYQILTSRGIQERFVKISKEAKRTNQTIHPDFDLLQLIPNKPGLIQEETPVSSESMPVNPGLSTQSKVKDNKEKKSINILVDNSVELSTSKIKTDDVGVVHSKVNIEEREKIFYTTIATFKDKYEKPMLREFFDYWTEKTPSGKKMKFELQKTFEVGKRLATWFRNQDTKIIRKNGPDVSNNFTASKEL